MTEIEKQRAARMEDVARAIFAERFGNCVGERWETASEADKNSHRDMAQAAIKAYHAAWVYDPGLHKDWPT